MSTTSSPLPAAISAFIALPEHTHMPDERAIGCREPRGERRRKGHSNRHVTVPNSR